MNLKHRHYIVYNIKEEYGEKVFCECGCLVRRMGLIQHRRAGIHTYRIRMIEEKKTEDENTENE